MTLGKIASCARIALSAIAAAIPAATAALPALAAEPDPIFGLIDAHRDARSQQIEALRAGHDDLGEDLAYEAFEIQVELLSTPPTTLPGCAALLRYVAELGPEDCAVFAPAECHDEIWLRRAPSSCR